MTQNALHNLQQKDLIRKRIVIEECDDQSVTVRGRKAIHFCSNDYLSLSKHPKVTNAFVRGVQKYGLGSGASNMIAGYIKPHQQLEEAFSAFLNRERSLLFNSGYHANIGVVTALAKSHSTIIADKLCHASLIDGIVLARHPYFRYAHNDVIHAKNLLKKNPASIVITESIFSMQGNIANISQIAQASMEHHSTLVVDDAHGIGVLGKHGKGICEHFHLTPQDIPCLVIPLGKALGSMGAIVSGDAHLIEQILQFSRTYYYSTAIPPAISYATREALKILQEETWRREKLLYLSDFFNKAAEERSIQVLFKDSPIKSIIAGENKTVIEIQNWLLEKGFFVSCVRPPTVPNGTARIRISLNCSLTEDHIIRLLDYLQICLSNLK